MRIKKNGENFIKCYTVSTEIRIDAPQNSINESCSGKCNLPYCSLVSKNNINPSMNDWVAVTVKKTSGNFSILDILNPTNKKEVETKGCYS